MVYLCKLFQNFIIIIIGTLLLSLSRSRSGRVDADIDGRVSDRDHNSDRSGFGSAHCRHTVALTRLELHEHYLVHIIRPCIIINNSSALETVWAPPLYIG